MEKIPDSLIDDLNKKKDIFAAKNNINKIITISIDEINKYAEKYLIAPVNIEIASLQLDIMPTRYERNYNTINFSEQIQLLLSTVAVIGCGGLGGNILEMLARLGIGNLILVDGDIFNESNLNRQLLSTENYIGKGKAEAAAARIKQINSSINTSTYSLFIDSTNSQKVITGANIVIDALDNIPGRFIVEAASKDLKIPFIHGAINNMFGQVSTIFPEDKGLKSIYGSPEKYNKRNIEDCPSVPSFTPAFVASLQVAETLKIILNKGSLLRNKLLLANLETMDINILEME